MPEHDTALEIQARDRATILVHYYRAMVGRADIWRTRMDTTTNWAIGATAAGISFALGNATAPHYVLHIAALMTFGFLMLEARRLTFYHLWQQRVRLLETSFIRPALSEGHAGADLVRELEPHLGRTVPTMPLWKATGRRLRRVYLYLFGVEILAWLLKLSIQPVPATSLGEVVSRAHLGALSGPVILALSLGSFAAAVAVAAARGGVDRRGATGDEPH